MRRNSKRILALLLSLLLLSGCGLTAGAEGSQEDEMIPFGQIAYERPEHLPEDFDRAAEQVSSALDRGRPLKRVIALLDDCMVLYNHFLTMYMVAEIRSYADLTDDFYAEEYAWCQEAEAGMQQRMEELYLTCGGSDMAQRLEEEYFWEGFVQEYGPGAQSRYTDEVVALMEQESELLAEYRALTASPSIVLDGQEVDFYSYLESAWGQDYLTALNTYYETYNPLFARIYIELVKNRQAQAAAMGYESYEQLC